MGFRNQGPKGRSGEGSLAEFCGGWGETQREESFVANKVWVHTHLSQAWGQNRPEKEAESLVGTACSLYPHLLAFSLPLYIH